LRDYARRGIEPVKLKSLIDLIAGIGFKGSRGQARDTCSAGSTSTSWASSPLPKASWAATIDEIAKRGHVLTPDRYVGAEEQAGDAEPFAEKYPRLVAELENGFAEGRRPTAVIREQLGRIEHE
jgi:type I restriction enzyme M protein